MTDELELESNAGEEELLGAAPKKPVAVKKPAPVRSSGVVVLYNRAGARIPVKGEARADQLRKRGYTDSPPKKAKA